MTTYNWISLFGIPAIILAIFQFAYRKLIAKVKATNTEDEAIKKGLQAMLRDRLYQLYRYCKNNGKASHFDRENFNNMYVQYHALGANGVMDNVHDKFFKLPIDDEE